MSQGPLSQRLDRAFRCETGKVKLPFLIKIFKKSKNESYHHYQRCLFDKTEQEKNLDENHLKATKTRGQMGQAEFQEKNV